MKRRTAIRIFLIGSLYTVLYFTYTLFSLHGSLKEIFSYWDSFLFLLGFVGIGGLSLNFLIRRSRLSLREKTDRPVPFLIGGSLTVFLILLITGLGGLLYKYLFFPDLVPGELTEMHPGFILQLFVLSFLTGIIYAVADHSLDSFRHLQDIRLSTRKLQTQQVNLRFESLRSQISPHFLFNSLNTISSLIYRDLNIAERFIRNMAGVYQSVLKNYRQPLVELDKEINLVEHYSYLMQVRFENAFHLEIDTGEMDHTYYVPPLSVQMLMENAIKHNQMSLDKPLKVSIRIENDYLVVRNNYIGDPGHVKIGKDLYKKPDISGSTGVGLENIRSRYRILSDKPVLISKDDYFTVAIPLITENEAEVVY